MKRSKPDLILLLALIFGLGITLSGMSQSDNRQPLTQKQMQESGVIVSQSR